MKETQPLWQDPAFWVSIASFVVAALSVAVSFITFFLTQLSPFRLTVLVGNPRWRREQVGRGPEGAGHPILTLTMPLLFVNTGALGGQVRDVIVEMAGGGDLIQFQPRFFAHPSKYSEMSERKSSFELSESEFYPFILAGREQIRKVLVLTPLKGNPLAPFATHTLRIRVKISSPHGATVWTRYPVGAFTMPQEGEKALEIGNAVVLTSHETRNERGSIPQD